MENGDNLRGGKINDNSLTIIATTDALGLRGRRRITAFVRRAG